MSAQHGRESFQSDPKQQFHLVQFRLFERLSGQTCEELNRAIWEHMNKMKKSHLEMCILGPLFLWGETEQQEMQLDLKQKKYSDQSDLSIQNLQNLSSEPKV